MKKFQSRHHRLDQALFSGRRKSQTHDPISPMTPRNHRHRRFRPFLTLMLVVVVAFVVLYALGHSAEGSEPLRQISASTNLRDQHLFHDKRTGKTLTVTATSVYSRPHWRRSSGFQTVVRVVYRSADTRWRATTDWAVSQWNRSGRIYMIRTSTCSTTSRNCVFVDTANMGANGVLGKAIGSGSDGHFWGDTNRVVINSYYAGSASDKNLMCHELGHSLGLPHPADGSQGPCVNGYPKQLDFDDLRLMYRHTDTSGPPGTYQGH